MRMKLFEFYPSRGSAECEEGVNNFLDSDIEVIHITQSSASVIQPTGFSIIITHLCVFYEEKAEVIEMNEDDPNDPSLSPDQPVISIDI